MLVLLHLLQHTLEQCWDGTCDANRVGRLCLRLQADVPRSFREYADPALAAADFVRYHRGLVALYQRALPRGEGIAATAVGKLLRSHETLFGDLIPPSDPLPDFHLADLEAGTRRAWAHIVAPLGEKEVPAGYLAEVGYALDALFAAGKTPLATYHHRQYLPDFMRMLRQIADDPRPKDWPKRMVEALVNHNFNYMGFFNRWKDQLGMELRQAWPQTHAAEVLARYQETVSLYHSLPTAFDPNRPALKALMAGCIGQLQKSVPENAQPAASLRTGLLAGDMAVRFRYRFKTGEFDYRTQKHAAHDFAQVHLNQTGLGVVAHTLTKFDKDALYAPALRYRRQLKEELRMLEKEFGLAQNR